MPRRCHPRSTPHRGQVDADGARIGRRSAALPRTAASALVRVLRGVPIDSLDRRSRIGVLLRKTRAELAEQLGGELTAAQEILLDEVAKKSVIVQALGEFILKQEQLVRPDGALLAAVVQHDRLQATLVSMLAQIGLKPREKPAPSLAEYRAYDGIGGSNAPGAAPTPRVT